jgi:hypothetical protein
MWGSIKRLGLVAVIAGCAVASAAVSPYPGSLNYIEGDVSLNGSALQPSAVGQSIVQEGQVLATAHGRAEFLLTPGVFLRLDHDSAVRMESPSLTDTRVRLVRGSAMVEAAGIEKGFVRKTRGLIQAPGAFQVSDRERVPEFGRFGTRTIFSL